MSCACAIPRAKRSCKMTPDPGISRRRTIIAMRGWSARRFCAAARGWRHERLHDLWRARLALFDEDARGPALSPASPCLAADGIGDEDIFKNVKAPVIPVIQFPDGTLAQRFHADDFRAGTAPRASAPSCPTIRRRRSSPICWRTWRTSGAPRRCSIIAGIASATRSR